MTLYAKDPDSTVDYSFDWAAWLTADETITATSWTISPSDSGAPNLGAQTAAGTVQGIFLSGGVAGNRYRLTCHIETDAGRTGERSLTLRIMER
ncbi:MAG: hypothetical protein HWE08_13560 [Alphaproteobacteria bacterium]|nr:hypothetical protein [Alphaproteobacteria bacterium]